MAPFKDRATVQVIDSCADLAAVHIQSTPLRLAKPARLRNASLTMRTLQSFRMTVLVNPFDAFIAIHQFRDWEVHAPILPQHLF
jgi:hypothetical protein